MIYLVELNAKEKGREGGQSDGGRVRDRENHISYRVAKVWGYEKNLGGRGRGPRKGWKTRIVE